MTQPEDLPTRQLLSAPPSSPALTPGQLDKLADIVSSFSDCAKSEKLNPFSKAAYANVISVLSAFILECQRPPTLDDLRKDLDSP